eukprot:TRINITY_DN622_c0_g1_i1.p2 TRINITY_DN622_c0_g1~~TRINITY_DN622_c0_g1_i1.p2  ORF type:complete len:371 (-),score=9.94 TRINITY_DN622_c0_g1_i1:47-1159(-)
MDKWCKILLTFLVYSAGTYVGTWIVLWTFLHIFDAGIIPSFWISGIVSGVVFFTLLISRLWANCVLGALYYLISVYWGVLMFGSAFSGLYLLIDLFCDIPEVAAVLIIVVPTDIFVLWGIIGSFCLVVQHVDISLRGVSENLRVVHLSDLHLGAIYGKNYLEKIVVEILKIAPDFVVITGDFFDGSMKMTKEMVEPLTRLTMNVYAILGNHDIDGFSIEEITHVLSDTKVVLLNDSQAQVKGVNLIGITYSKGSNYVAQKLSTMQIRPDIVNILLYHAPTLETSQLDEYKLRLHLTGHTHGGQFIPCQLYYWVAFPYTSGLHYSKDKMNYIYVSDGAGTSGPPFRILTSNSISVLNIHDQLNSFWILTTL